MQQLKNSIKFFIPQAGKYKYFLQEYLLRNLLKFPMKIADRYGLCYYLYPEDRGRYFYLGKTLFDDPAVFAVAKKYLNPGDSVVDIGANIGLFSLYASLLVPVGTVYAIEAEQSNYNKLLQNMQLNQSANIVAERYLIADTIGKRSLHVFTKKGILNSMGLPAQIPGTNDPDIPDAVQVCPAITLDRFATDRHIKSIDLLKLDVEGAEIEVLSGCSTLLERGIIKRLIFEVSQKPLVGMGHTAMELFKLIEMYGFQIYRINPDGSLVNYSPDVDSQVQLANFMAMRSK